jgi:predicted component of type VI protein secretion system
MVDDGYVGVRDLESKNGTFVNAERIIGERPLQAGDRVKVGPLEFEIVLSTGVGGKKRPAVTGGVKEAAARAASTVADVDVSQWLAPEAGSGAPSAGLHDTGRLTVASSDTEEIDLGATKELLLPDEANAAADATRIDPPAAALKKTDPKAKKEPGKLPMSARLMAKDSRDAAAKVLEMMKKRR